VEREEPAALAITSVTKGFLSSAANDEGNIGGSRTLCRCCRSPFIEDWLTGRFFCRIPATDRCRAANTRGQLAGKNIVNGNGKKGAAIPVNMELFD
jgi:hypothetical protein